MLMPMELQTYPAGLHWNAISCANCSKSQNLKHTQYLFVGCVLVIVPC